MCSLYFRLINYLDGKDQTKIPKILNLTELYLCSGRHVRRIYAKVSWKL